MTGQVKVIPVFKLVNKKIIRPEGSTGLNGTLDPVEAARRCYRDGADEIAIFDTDVPRERFGIWEGIIKNILQAIEIPLIFGNNANVNEDFEDILNSGVQTAALGVTLNTDPSIIDMISRHFGPERMTVAISGVKNERGSGRPPFEIVNADSGKPTDLDLVEWVKMVEMMGSGSIMLTGFENKGTGVGYDIELTRAVTSVVSIPVIACGGAGKLEDFARVITEAGASGVAATSVFSKGSFSPRQIKEYLASKGIAVSG